MGGNLDLSSAGSRARAYDVEWKRQLRRALHLSVVVLSTAGCSRAPAQPPEAAGEASAKAATITVRPLDAAPEALRVLVEVKLPEGQLYRKPDPARLELFRDEFTRPALLNDVGRERDRVAGDGLYTGEATLRMPLDFSEKESVVLAAQATDPSTIDPERSIVIRHLNVVQDAQRTHDVHTNAGGTTGGEWTFAALMKGALGADAPAAVLRWLRHWEQVQAMDGADVAARAEVNAAITEPWLTASGGQSLDLDKAPFRLLAIVNRLDMEQRERACPKSGGELRFVFGLVSREENAVFPRAMSVIFEYGQSGLPDLETRDRARQWIDLGDLDPENDASAFNAALAALTSKVTTKPGGLNHIRTSELDLATTGTGTIQPWELRSFAIEGGDIVLKPLEQTPLEKLNGGSALAAHLTSNAGAIRGGTHCVPETVAGERFQAWSATMFPRSGDAPTELGFFWYGPQDGSLAGDDRFAFSRNTCNGCHSGETATAASHVDPTTPIGKQAELSRFLTESVLTVADPSDIKSGATPVTQRTHTEMSERKKALAALADLSCGSCMMVDPNYAAH